jgi:hypothetical protein
MTKFLVKIFGASWQTTLAGLLGGIAIAVWPILQSAINTQMTGVRVDWNNVLMGVVIAIGGYLAKAHNASNSPTPLVHAQTVVPVPVVETNPVPAMAQPAVIPQPEPPPGKY